MDHAGQIRTKQMIKDTITRIESKATQKEKVEVMKATSVKADPNPLLDMDTHHGPM